MERQRIALDGLRDGLRALGPAATLARGYAVARLADGTVVRSPGQVARGDALEVVVLAGRMATTVESTSEAPAEELLT